VLRFFVHSDVNLLYVCGLDYILLVLYFSDNLISKNSTVFDHPLRLILVAGTWSVGTPFLLVWTDNNSFEPWSLILPKKTQPIPFLTSLCF